MLSTQILSQEQGFWFPLLRVPFTEKEIASILFLDDSFSYTSQGLCLSCSTGNSSAKHRSGYLTHAPIDRYHVDTYDGIGQMALDTT